MRSENAQDIPARVLLFLGAVGAHAREIESTATMKHTATVSQNLGGGALDIPRRRASDGGPKAAPRNTTGSFGSARIR
jgi:hypothetical protein